MVLWERDVGKLAVIGVLIGMVLLMGCTETARFEQVSHVTNLVDFEGIGDFNVLYEVYQLGDTEIVCYLTHTVMPLNDYRAVVNKDSEKLKRDDRFGFEAYNFYPSTWSTDYQSIMWYSNETMHQVGCHTEEDYHKHMVNLFKQYEEV